MQPYNKDLTGMNVEYAPGLFTSFYPSPTKHLFEYIW
jgi:hypothetical protein